MTNLDYVGNIGNSEKKNLKVVESGGWPPVVGLVLLTAVASLAAEHGLWGRRASGVVALEHPLHQCRIFKL